MPRNIRLKKPPEGYFWRIEKQGSFPFFDEAVLYREVPPKSWWSAGAKIERVSSVDLELHSVTLPDGTVSTREDETEAIFRMSEFKVNMEHRKNNLGEYSIELVD